MKNMRMSAKLTTGFALVLVLTILMSVVSIVSLNNLFASASLISDFETPGLYWLGQITSGLQGVRSEMRAMLVYINEDDHQSFEAKKALMLSMRATVADNIESYKGTIRVTEGQTMFNSFVSDYNTFDKMVDAFLKDCDEWNYKSGLTSLVEITPIMEKTLTSAEDLLQHRRVQAKDVIAQSEKQYKTTVTASFIILAIVLAVSVIVVLYLTKIIVSPLAKMKAVLDQVATTGSMEFSDEIKGALEVDAKYKDEIGGSISSFCRMMDHFVLMTEELDYLSKGDLTHTIKGLSPDDTMANSMNTLITNVNAMFSNISLSSDQVSTGAKQIADGSQTLAQGSTEQASSVEELSSSIADVANSINHAAESAQNAANLADSIKHRAAQGADQMNHMMEAVQGIAEASQSISKVIAVIDQIAFQTNILALNASVEAAHAGEHGRGFAVVADEVRQLASKSAEAAKDTSSLIENSIQKAELGARIAGDTNASLQEIIEGINQSSQLVAEIARDAEAQASSIAQINIGIDQVAQVVQQNSATAQESAAASQEMSSQSQILRDLIGQFKLKHGTTQRTLNAASSASAAPAYERENDYQSGGAGYGKY